MIKALFFDIDGTLVSFKTHTIPQSAIVALTKAHVIGVKIFISTGRPRMFVTNLRQIEHLIDGYVTTNGALCVVGERTISMNAMPDGDVRTMIDFCNTGGFSAVVCGRERISTINYNRMVEEIFVENLKVSHETFNSPLEEVLKDSILQITPFITDDDERKLGALLSGSISSRWHPDFADFTSAEADKGKGIQLVANVIGADISECAAFGDGGNDIPMLLRAGVGVAMGNANDDVKAAADHVTSSIDDDGISNALRNILHFDQ